MAVCSCVFYMSSVSSYVFSVSFTISLSGLDSVAKPCVYYFFKKKQWAKHYCAIKTFVFHMLLIWSLPQFVILLTCVAIMFCSYSCAHIPVLLIFVCSSAHIRVLIPVLLICVCSSAHYVINFSQWVWLSSWNWRIVSIIIEGTCQ